MTKKQALKYFGTVRKMSRATGFTEQCIYQWPAIIPWRAQCVIQVVSGGNLRAGKQP